ncbi:hypothetical protein ACIGFK_13175 [Streptomyces sp. NPDC085524]|uniref:hypothetical protein n=1 Tax=Streptomyces sp. NPDC085524 TaxID=3365728 RepID=UPI0037D1D006
MPASVIAQYLTVASATVDVTGSGLNTRYQCTGCHRTSPTWPEATTRTKAQTHAAKCRAIPRPTA